MASGDKGMGGYGDEAKIDLQTAAALCSIAGSVQLLSAPGCVAGRSRLVLLMDRTTIARHRGFVCAVRRTLRWRLPVRVRATGSQAGYPPGEGGTFRGTKTGRGREARWI